MFFGNRHFRIVLTTVLATYGSAAFAQQGPDLGCEDCPEFFRPPFPETGIWGNPDQSGLGFMLEVQGGKVGGFYFGYDEAGEAIWYLVAGDLESIDEPVRGWRLTADLEDLTGGPCINCLWQPFDVDEPAGEVEFMFEQRSFGRYRIDGGNWQNIQPLTFGVALEPLPTEQTPYLFPTLEGFWSITIELGAMYTSRAVRIGDLIHDEENTHEENGYVIRAKIFSAMKPGVVGPPSSVLGELRCGPHPDAASPLCEVELDEFDVIYRMPVTALTDSYFRAEHPEQTRVMEAHRLNYD